MTVFNPKKKPHIGLDLPHVVLYLVFWIPEVLRMVSMGSSDPNSKYASTNVTAWMR